MQALQILTISIWRLCTYKLYKINILFHGIKLLLRKEFLKNIYCKQHNLILVTLLLESSLSPCPCICQDVMDASICRCSLVLHQYRVNLGQPKVKLGERPSWVPRVALHATKIKGSSFSYHNLVVIEMSFSHHMISIIKQFTIENF